MKGILNVLYRRILYKIPFKFLLLLLGIGAILFASVNADYSYMETIRIGYGGTWGAEAGKCYIFNSSNTFNIVDGNYTVSFQGNNPDNSSQYGIYCFDHNGTITNNGSTVYINNFVKSSSNCDYSGYLTQLECSNLYSGYILESSVDSSYCQSNNLCPVYTGECENLTGVNWSSLYINNIQHIGGPNIYIDIPEELSWDYDYTDEDMYIDIEGYNVDYDKITSIINTQNYKPTTEDFNYIVSSIIPLFVPGLVIILFLYWIFRFIKKIF